MKGSFSNRQNLGMEDDVRQKTTLTAMFAICLSLAVFTRGDGVFGFGGAALFALAIGVACFAMIEKFRNGNNDAAVALAFFVGIAGVVVCLPSLVAPEAVSIDNRMNALRKATRRVLDGSETYASLDVRATNSYHFGWTVLVEGELASQADLEKLYIDFRGPLNELHVCYPVDAGVGHGNKQIFLDTSNVTIQGKPSGSPSL